MATLRGSSLITTSVTLSGWRKFIAPLAIVVVGLGMWALWSSTARTVSVSVDGGSEVIKTHRRDVSGLLFDLGFQPEVTDRVTPSLDTPIRGTTAVSFSRAVPYQISIDGTLVQTTSWGATIADVLSDANLSVEPYDTVFVNEIAVGLDAAAPAARVSRLKQTYRRVVWNGERLEPNRIRVDRATAITVDDGTLPFDIHTTSRTVGEALRDEEITIYLGDVVVPSLGSEVVPGMRVTIQRSRPIEIVVDGQLVKTRTRAETVADALAQTHIGLSGLDRVSPDLESELRDGERIAIVRVQEDIEIEEEIAPYSTVYVPDANLPIDTQQLITPGAEGITRTRYRVRYEDGDEVTRELEDTWIAQEPAERSIAYGQQIEPKTFTAPNGIQYTYWRKVRMLASSYSAGTSGVSAANPHYGLTYTGDTMRHGIVAVDPSVVPLRSKVYVTEYGEGDALDVGSAILARRIDLGYDDSNLVLWNKWVDVYLLWPPPPSYQITWVLPNWPKPPQ
ncbi:MAG: ubiquitin-like domain-containing protein [Caldilineaceae bacterium]